MNKLFTTVAAAVAFSAAAPAAEITRIPDGAVTGVSVDRTASSIVVSMTVHPDAFPKKACREVWLRPVIEAGGQVLTLDSVLIAGRTRYYQRLRGNERTPGMAMLRFGEAAPYEYSVTVPYEPWMDYLQLSVRGRVASCAGNTIADNLADFYDAPLLTMDYRDKVLDAVMVYVSPVREEVKVRDVSKECYIDFPVNKTEIYPDYRRNPEELADIRRTIDEIQSDEDITITSVDFTGYASPEGPYSFNEKLAQERTQALLNYVNRYFDFPRQTLHYSSVAEDWAGLERRVREMDGLANKDELLQLISDGSIDPDEKDRLMKRDFPDDYFILLSKVYPSLRHTDYKVSYTVRSFTDVEKIAVLVRTAPQKLSLDEIYTYAQTLDHGSQDFQDVMDIAVRMYPDDPIANLNAGVTATEKGDLTKAKAYLKKTPESPEATYTLAVIYVKEDNIPAALPLLREASAQGIQPAAALLQQIQDYGLE